MIDQVRKTSDWANLLEQIIPFPGKKLSKSLGLIRSARFPVTTALLQDTNRPILFITDKPAHGLLAYDEIGFWNPDSERYLFPAPDPLFYEQASWGSSVQRERIQVLALLARYSIPSAEKLEKHPLIIAPIRAVMTRTLEKKAFIKASRMLHCEQEIVPESLIRSWAAIGYEPVETVLDSGQFSKRGGLLDIWPHSEPYPIRIDFFGDEIDTIQRFDPSTQRNLQKIKKIFITPAREILIDSDPAIDILSMNCPEFNIPLYHTHPTCLLDFLPENTLIITDDWELIRLSADEIEEQAEVLRKQSIREETLPEDFPTPYISISEISDDLESLQWLNLARQEMETDLGLASRFEPAERFGGRIQAFIDLLLDKFMSHESVMVVSRQAQRLEELWKKLETDPADLFAPKIISGAISEGYKFRNEDGTFFYVLTDSEIFGWERPLPRKSQKQIVDTPEKYFADLKPGDFVVHIDYGIGQYIGLVSRTIDGVIREFLCIQYDKGDQLFVPVHQADRLTNYIGPDGRKPELTRLGTQEWLTIKQHVQENVLEVAEDLLDLYSKRQVASGFAFSQDSTWQQDMEGSFPYIETDDQKQAIRQVKEDMERNRPMDRLICGDVGYGKTEVALRAAFKAGCDSKQVAVLVPTTVLAQQHYETFKKRFAAYPINVEMLSRFRTAKEQDQILKRLADGDIDVIIGTHRLVSQDVKFKDLGLVIIDEEQRFGVAQKEYLKKLRTEVDVLTMTATPIPRTLYMALTGVRDISNINTPPDERVPIITHVGPYSDKLVRQAILREMEREGQVFFVHNRVQTIYAIEHHLRTLIPEARISVCHGQLPEKQLAEVMDKFYNGDTDVLLSTSIIESGLDIPNANTLIIDRADTLGLAQLYQIRGRVGRSSQRAYAYFFRQRNQPPTEEGLERLEVIAENTQLGAGYSIAMRDLEMRGAGEILGNRQHGAIASVGFHLYTRLLAQAVRNTRAVKGIGISDEEIGITKEMAYIFNPITVELPLNIGIPEDYIREQKSRIKLYRRMASVHDTVELTALRDEFTDRFGQLPETVENLFFQIFLKIKAEKIGFAGIVKEGDNIVLRFPSLPEGVESRELPAAGAGIRVGKNAYWLTMLDLESDSWRNDLLTAIELIEDRLIQTANPSF
ncbi:MAG: transcription-repair coupling factor [Flexilinea sp.]